MRDLNEFGYQSFDSYRGRESSRGVHYSDHDYGAFGHHRGKRDQQHRNEYQDRGQHNSPSGNQQSYGHGYDQNDRGRRQDENYRGHNQQGNYQQGRPEYASGQNTRGNDSHNQYNDWNRERGSSDEYWNQRDNQEHKGIAHRGGDAAHEYAQRQLWERQHRVGQREPGHRLDWADQASAYSRNHGWDDQHPKDWNTSPNRSYYDEF